LIARPPRNNPPRHLRNRRLLRRCKSRSLSREGTMLLDQHLGLLLLRWLVKLARVNSKGLPRRGRLRLGGGIR
jgi:hypothetical protein